MAADFVDPSALLTATMSAYSVIPLFIIWSSSPPTGGRTSTIQSTKLDTDVSFCPTPTVSINILSYPAALTNSTLLSIALFTPPKHFPEGEARTKASALLLRLGILVLSPSIAPPECTDDGSTANTATLCPSSISSFPSFSINEDFPAPGGPDIATL